MNPTELATILLRLHADMIDYQDNDVLAKTLKRTLSPEGPDPHERSETVGQKLTYNSVTYAAILQLAKENIITDWDSCFAYTLEKMRQHEILPHVDCRVQELLVYLASFGLYQDKDLTSYPDDRLGLATEELGDSSSSNIYPQVSHLTLKVPRKVLNSIASMSSKFSNTDMRLCLSDGSLHNIHTFMAIQCFFGSFHFDSSNNTIYSVIEDSIGWNGSSDLVLSCPVPTSLFTKIHFNKTIVTLMTNSDQVKVPTEPEWGDRRIYWASPLNDGQKRVFLSRTAPIAGDNSPEQSSDVRDLSFQENSKVRETSLEQNLKFMTLKPSVESSCISAQVSRAGIIEALYYHHEIPKGSEQSEALAKKARVDLQQADACRVEITIGNSKPWLLEFPVSIIASAARIKVARKNSWIGVTAPLRPAAWINGPQHLMPLPLTSNDPPVLTTWMTPRINLDRHSKITLSKDSAWLIHHMEHTLRPEEKSVLSKHPPGSPHWPQDGGKLEFRRTMMLMFSTFAGRNPISGQNQAPCNEFRPHVNGEFQMVFYANHLRHDPSTSSVVLDAWVIETQDFLAIRAPSKTMLNIGISNQELEIWKFLLPSVVERCRIGWRHRQDCDYLAAGHVPLSVLPNTATLCSCGKGKAAEHFPTSPKSKQLAKKATRIALHPLFLAILDSAEITRINLCWQVIGTNDSQGQTGRYSSYPIASTSSHPPSKSASKPTCDQCGLDGVEMKLCQRCRVARYCNRECQKAAWKEHKKVCN
ncbi:hypothetical protein ACLMJK_006341 [Lecanora helva]